MLAAATGRKESHPHHSSMNVSSTTQSMLEPMIKEDELDELLMDLESTVSRVEEPVQSGLRAKAFGNEIAVPFKAVHIRASLLGTVLYCEETL